MACWVLPMVPILIFHHISYPIDLGASSWISTMTPNLRMYLVFEKYLSVRYCQNLKLPLVVLAVLLGLLHYAYELTLVQFIAKSFNMI